MEGLINTTIENNKLGRKTTINHLGKDYPTTEELKTLLFILNTKAAYKISLYGKVYGTYISNIKLINGINAFFKELGKYEGNIVSKQQVQEIIDRAVYVIKNTDESDLEITIVYSSLKIKLKHADIENEKEIVNSSIESLKNSIKREYEYKIECRQVSDTKLYITITQEWL